VLDCDSELFPPGFSFSSSVSILVDRWIVVVGRLLSVHFILRLLLLLVLLVDARSTCQGFQTSKVVCL
jgi:hypothetical protein